MGKSRPAGMAHIVAGVADDQPTMLAYLRVSTEEQAETGHGLSAQEIKLRAAFAQRGWEFHSYRDEGLSGKSLERPALRAALERIASGDANGLVVAKLDRLSRSMVDFGMLLEFFNAANAALIALDFDIDTTTPNGRLVANVLMSVASWEADMISQRTSDALQAIKASGRPVGPPAVCDETRALITRLRGEGLTLREIARRLNAENVPTARGGRWSQSTVHTALGHRRRPSRRRSAELPKIRRQR
jgi:DNA invertase Pin-like site-specific DNA recombinase